MSSRFFEKFVTIAIIRFTHEKRRNIEFKNVIFEKKL